MKTTALFVEHLITGIQAAVWIALIVASYFGPAQLKPDAIKGFETVVAFLVLSIIYPIGVFVDNLADFLLNKWSEHIRDDRMRTENFQGNSLVIMKVLKDTDDDYLKAYISYIRTRVRISRSTAFNFALITICTVLFTATRLHTLPPQQFWRLMLFAVVVGTLSTVSALLAWRSITKTFAKQVVRASQIFGTPSALVGAAGEVHSPEDC